MKTRYSALDIQKKYRPIISVFGSSTCEPQSPLYELSYKIGKILSSHGLTIANGGYTGTMDAISKGASENRGEIIGITTDEIVAVSPSPYLTQEFREESLYSRLDLISNIADLFLFLPGSTGTLTELSLILDRQKLGLINPVKPMILYGKTWENIFLIMFGPSSDPLVPKSKWKKDNEVEAMTFCVLSLEELQDRLAKITSR